jgi:hypothetical protein
LSAKMCFLPEETYLRGGITEMEEMMDGIGLVRIRRPFSGTRRRTAKQILETCRVDNVEWESPKLHSPVEL